MILPLLDLVKELSVVTIANGISVITDVAENDVAENNVDDEEVVYTSRPLLRRPVLLFIDMLKDFKRGRTLAYRLFLRDLKARYRESYLGYAWAFLPILVTTCIFVFLRASGSVRFEETPIPYPAFALIGMVLWQTFVDAMQIPLRAVRSARSMLTKINFPREAILVAALGEVAFNLLIRMVLVACIFLWFQIVPPLTIFAVPFGLVALTFLGLLASLALMPVSLLYTDIAKGLPLVTMTMLFLTPVLYPPPPSGIGKYLAQFNPASILLQPTREWMTTGSSVSVSAFVTLTIIMMVGLLWGLMVFRVSMPHVIARMEN
ncbi:MAG: ABC transporter permease [Planctomycetota bacterium]